MAYDLRPYFFLKKWGEVACYKFRNEVKFKSREKSAFDKMIYLSYGILAVIIFIFGRKILKFLIGRAVRRRQVKYMHTLEADLNPKARAKARAKADEAIEAARIKALAQMYLDNAGH